MSASFNFTDITLGVLPAGDGLKAVPLSSSGCQILWTPDAQTVAFEPSAYKNEDAKRVNLVMRASPQAAQALEELDAYILDLCKQNSSRLFGEELSSETLASRYVPCLKRSDKGGDPIFKAKIELEGHWKLKCWNQDRDLCDPPCEWSGRSVRPRIALKCIWLTANGSFGCQLQCSDILLLPHEEVACPF